MSSTSWHSYLLQYELPGGSTARRKSFRFNPDNPNDKERAEQEARYFARSKRAQWWRIDLVTQTVVDSKDNKEAL